jgi:hypothetical protein
MEVRSAIKLELSVPSVVGAVNVVVTLDIVMLRSTPLEDIEMVFVPVSRSRGSLHVENNDLVDPIDT